jgi:hypothetical protein
MNDPKTADRQVPAPDPTPHGGAGPLALLADVRTAAVLLALAVPIAGIVMVLAR